MELLKQVFLIIFGFASGVVISGAVFAFIAIIGIVPSMAYKTKTTNNIIFYEEAIIFGGTVGTIISIFDLVLPIGSVFVVLLALLAGIFLGCLTMSLAETLDVVPILSRRLKISDGMFIFIIAIAISKLIGSFLYFMVPGFFKYD